MPNTTQTKIYHDLSGGLYTEINPLQEHVNTTLDETNFTILKDKSRRRRLGVDKVDGTTSLSLGGSPCAYYVWENAGNQGVDLYVYQISSSIKIFDDTSLVHTIDLEELDGSGNRKRLRGNHTVATDFCCDFTSLKGYLFIVGKGMDPMYVEWDGSTFTEESYTIDIRDTDGLEDDLETDERPSTLTLEHEYNLANQGWDKKKINKYFYRSKDVEQRWLINYILQGATTVVRISLDQDPNSDYDNVITNFTPTLGISVSDTVILDNVSALPELNGVLHTVTAVNEAAGTADITLSTDSSAYITSTEDGTTAGSTATTGTYQTVAVDTAVPPITTTTTVPQVVTTTTGGEQDADARWVPSSGILIHSNASNSVYPSNAQIWYLGRDEDNEFSPWMLDQHEFGNTEAPKGKFIYDAFDMDRDSNLLGIVGTGSLTNWSDNNRPEEVEVLGGRLVYSKIDSDPQGGMPSRSSDIFVSQLLTEIGNAGKCYQDADPTSEDISDLIITDGVLIHAYQALKIVGIYSDDVALSVFSSRGTVFELESQLGFDATSYSLNKSGKYVTEYKDSFVEVPGGFFFWSDSGIIFVDAAKRSYDNISLPKINTFYHSILNKDSVGYYDKTYNQVRWLCGVHTEDAYDTEVILDLDFESFFLYSFPVTEAVTDAATDEPNRYAHGHTHRYRNGYGNGYGPGPADASGNSPGMFRYKDKYGEGYPTYLAIDGSYNVSDVAASRDDFLDFYYWDDTGVDAGAYLIFADDNLNETFRSKQAPYIGFTFEVTETLYDTDFVLQNESACIVRAAWDYSNDIASNKWTPEYSAYRLLRPILRSAGDDLSYGQKYLNTKLNFPGSGKAIAIMARTDPGKDCHIYGWSILFEGRSTV